MIKCACGKTNEYDIKGNVGKAMKATGWNWIPLPDGYSIWLCTECNIRAKKLAEELVEVTGTEYPHIPCLLK